MEIQSKKADRIRKTSFQNRGEFPVRAGSCGRYWDPFRKIKKSRFKTAPTFLILHSRFSEGAARRAA